MVLQAQLRQVRTALFTTAAAEAVLVDMPEMVATENWQEQVAVPEAEERTLVVQEIKAPHIHMDQTERRAEA